jgi:sugar (pentulose or hexulose) kinase
VGIYDNLQESQKWIEYTEEIVPDPTNQENYSPLYMIYRQLYENTKGLMSRLSSVNLSD